MVGANSEEAVDTLRRLYKPILEQTFDPPSTLPRPSAYHLPPMMTTDPNSAEMIKYAANTFLALKISFINEIAGLCEKVGADVTEVARGIGLDARIGNRFLQAGLGWGGSCYPKDTSALLGLQWPHSAYDRNGRLQTAARTIPIFRQRARFVIIKNIARLRLKLSKAKLLVSSVLPLKPNTQTMLERSPVARHYPRELLAEGVTSVAVVHMIRSGPDPLLKMPRML